MRGPEVGKWGHFAVEETQIHVGLTSVLATLSDTNFARFACLKSMND